MEVASCEKLRELKLEDCELGGDGCEAVARALSGLTSLEVLDLRNNDMDDSAECVALLAEALRGNARLKKVALDEDLDVEVLREALREAGVEAALHFGEDEEDDGEDEGAVPGGTLFGAPPASTATPAPSPAPFSFDPKNSPAFGIAKGTGQPAGSSTAAGGFTFGEGLGGERGVGQESSRGGASHSQASRH